ncbi:MAG: ArsR/SmtB family transcription factor [Planctomycetota bacterium]|jgi:DNA-binding transcriptional ArsR family regulator
MTIHRAVEADVMREAVAAFRAAGEPSRFRILKALEGGELCVCHVVEILGLSQPTVSRHLKVLLAAGLLEERKAGRWTFFRLSPASPYLKRILRLIRGLAEANQILDADRIQATRLRDTPLDGSCATGGRRRT